MPLLPLAQRSTQEAYHIANIDMMKGVLAKALLLYFVSNSTKSVNKVKAGAA
jgi:hypothetical protein